MPKWILFFSLNNQGCNKKIIFVVYRIGLTPKLIFLLEKFYLSELVEGHDNDRGAVSLDELGLSDEILFAFLEGDGVDNALTLTAFEAGLQHREVGGVLKRLNSLSCLIINLLLPSSYRVYQGFRKT